MSAWPFIVFGFPGALASVALCGLGIARLKPLFLLLGAVLATPSAFYLGLAGWWPMLLIPGFPLGAAAAIISQRRVLASILMLPNIAVAFWMTAAALSNMIGTFQRFDG